MSSSIRVDRIHHPVTALGPGRRLGIWTQGCSLACPGCMSQHTWDAEGGREVAVTEIVDAWREALTGGADGVTISGGEPLEQPGIGDLLGELAAARTAIRPESDVLLYTGHSEREARRRAPDAVAAADAMITGRFVAGRPTRLVWRGSANQRLIPLSALGVSRYTPYVDHEPARPPIQLGRDGSDLWLIGVPRAGDLKRLTEAARRSGIADGGSTWA